MSQFLIIYDRKTGQLLGDQEFTDAERDQATEAKRQAERTHRGQRNIEVVLLGSANRANLERTHSRYFKRLSELTPG